MNDNRTLTLFQPLVILISTFHYLCLSKFNSSFELSYYLTQKSIILKKTAFLFALCFLFSTIATAQNQENDSTIFNFQRLITLDEHKETEEIIIDIKEQTKNFKLDIETLVSSGKLTIEIYDSTNKKQGTFSVGTQLDLKDSEEAKGNITKSLIEPQPGKWKVKIIPISATGGVKINTITFL